jgi:hypothetical protein
MNGVGWFVDQTDTQNIFSLPGLWVFSGGPGHRTGGILIQMKLVLRGGYVAVHWIRRWRGCKLRKLVEEI